MWISWDGILQRTLSESHFCSRNWGCYFHNATSLNSFLILTSHDIIISKDISKCAVPLWILLLVDSFEYSSGFRTFTVLQFSHLGYLFPGYTARRSGQRYLRPFIADCIYHWQSLTTFVYFCCQHLPLSYFASCFRWLRHVKYFTCIKVDMRYESFESKSRSTNSVGSFFLKLFHHKNPDSSF